MLFKINPILYTKALNQLQLKGHSSQVFHGSPKCWKSLKQILTEFELSTSSCFQDIEVQFLLLLQFCDFVGVMTKH